MEANINKSINNSVIGNNYLELLKRNKYIIFAFSLIIILFIIIFTMFYLTAKNTNNKENIPIPSLTNTVTPIDTTPTRKPIPTEDKQTIEIETQAKPQIDKLVQGLSYDFSIINTYSNTWALVEITNPTTDPAKVFLKKESGYWRVMMGPGTSFNQQDLTAIGVPQILINEVITSSNIAVTPTSNINSSGAQ